MPERPTSVVPAGWREIHAAILARAAGRCERCQAPTRVPVVRAADGCWYDPAAGWRDDRGRSGERRACRAVHGFDREALTAETVGLTVADGWAGCGVCRGAATTP